MPKTKAWQRLGAESIAHYELFIAYRNLPTQTRSVELVFKSLSEEQRYSLNTLRDLCAEFRWVNRSNAYQDFVHEQVERAERYERVKSLRAMRARHRDSGKKLMGKAMGFLRNKHLKITSIREAVMLVKVALELEQSGHTFDPSPAIVSGDEVEQPTEQTEARRLAIEVFTTDGKPLPADDLRNTLIAFYDQQPGETLRSVPKVEDEA